MFCINDIFPLSLNKINYSYLGESESIKSSRGCGLELPSQSEPGDAQKYYIMVNDPYMGEVNRTFMLHLPLYYPVTNDQPVPMVLDFHGTGGHAVNHHNNGGFDDVADEDINGGFIVVKPQGVGMGDPIDLIEGKGGYPSWNCSNPIGPQGPVCVLPRNQLHPWEKMRCFDSCPGRLNVI